VNNTGTKKGSILK